MKLLKLYMLNLNKTSQLMVNAITFPVQRISINIQVTSSINLLADL